MISVLDFVNRVVTVRMIMSKVNERVNFRMFRTPCCGHQLCWVNPRLPTFCPECGTLFDRRYMIVMIHDENAMIKYENPNY